MRKSMLIAGSAVAVVVAVLAFVLFQDMGSTPGDQVVAQAPDTAPVLEKEVRSWCTGSCSGGNDSYQANPATYTMRADGSMHFISDVNYAACPSMKIPDDVEGWYFGTSSSSIQSQFATAEAAGTEDSITYATTGVQKFDDDSRQSDDLLICEAVFYHSDD